jgi:hypothetical protein
MTTSREQIQACFAKLRSLGLQPPRMAADGYELMLAAWAEKLGGYDPRAVRAAFDRWGEEREDWPLPKHLLPMVDAQQARLEKRLAPPRQADNIADLNAALEAVMRKVPGAFLVELYELGQQDPELKRRVVNRLAEWAQAGGGSTDDAAAYCRALMCGPTEAVA